MPDKQSSKEELLAQKAAIDATLAEMARPIAQQAKDFVDQVDEQNLRELAAEARGICSDVADQIQHVLTCLGGLRATAEARLQAAPANSNMPPLVPVGPTE